MACSAYITSISRNPFIANLEYEQVNHLLPTFHGDTLYGRTEVLDKWESKSKKDRGIVYVETTVNNQDCKDVLSFRRKMLVPKREFATRPYTHSQSIGG